MPERDLEAIRQLLARCSENEKRALFAELRASLQLHPLEAAFGAPAEVILEAIHRAPELTRRMLRGVIADAAFSTIVVPLLAARGWQDVTPEGNFAFDHMLADASGTVTVQVKLQRSAKGSAVVTTGSQYGLAAGMYMVETQRTRTGRRRTNGEPAESAVKTRPYRYGDFQILAVSLQPSTGDWSRFRYTVADWLLPGHTPEQIATYQPVAMQEDDDWTDDFNQAAQRLRTGTKKRIRNSATDSP